MGLVGSHGNQANPMAIAAAGQLVSKLRQLFEVCAAYLSGINKMAIGRRFERGKLSPLAKR